MNINSNELLLLKKIKFAAEGENDGKSNGAMTTALSTEPEQPEASMNRLMFQGLKNVVSDPQLAQETGALNNVETQPKEEGTEKEYIAPYKSNLAFQGNAGRMKTYAFAAMMGLATLGASTMLQSCEDVVMNQTVTVDMEEYNAMMQEMLNEMRALREDMAKYNEAMAEKYDKAIAMITKLYELLLKQELDNATFKATVIANQEIIIELMVSNGYTQEEANKKLEAILTALNKQNLTIEELNALIQELKGLVSDIKGLLQQAIKDLQEYADRASQERQELIETNKKGFEELIQRGDITNETLKNMQAQYDSVISLSNKQIEAQEKIKRVIEQANIDSNANFETVVATINANKNELISTLMRLGYTQNQIIRMTAGEIIKAIDKNTEVTRQGNALLVRITKQLMILPELYKNGKITNAKLQEFYNLYQQAIAAGGEFTQEMLDKLDKLATELEKIEGILNDMNQTLKGMSENLNKFYQDYHNDKKMEFKMFGQLIKDNKLQSHVLINMAQTQKGMSENLEGIKANTDTLLVIAKDDTRFNELIETIKNAQNGGNTEIDYDRLEEMFKLLNMNLTDVIKMSSYQLQQAIKNFQNTYVKTEQAQTKQLESINNKLDDLQIFLENNNNNSDNKAVIDAINNLTSAVNDGKEDITDELKAIEAKLDALQATVNSILDAAGAQASKIDALFDQWGPKFDNILNSLNNIDSKIGTIISNQKIAAKYLANIESEVKNIKLEIQKLQNQAGGNIDYDKLEEMWQKHDAENYEKYSKLIKDLDIKPADLKTVEDLLKSIDKKMDNIKDNSDILTQILNKLNGIDWTSPDYSEKLDRIIELLENFKCNCNCGGSNEGILGDLDEILGE